MCEYNYFLSARRKLEVDVKVGKSVRHLPDREHSHLPGRDGEHSHKNTKLRQGADFDRHSYLDEVPVEDRVGGEILEEAKGMPARAVAQTLPTCGQIKIN